LQSQYGGEQINYVATKSNTWAPGNVEYLYYKRGDVVQVSVEQNTYIGTIVETGKKGIINEKHFEPQTQKKNDFVQQIEKDEE